MAVSRRHAVNPTRWLAVALVGAAIISAVAAAGVSALTLIVARTVVSPPRRRADDIRILSIGGAGGLITLEATPEAALPGEYGLFFSSGAGHARLGEVLAASPRSITRRLLAVDHGDISSARRGRMSGWFYAGPADLGFPFADVHIATELGPAPAWLIPSEGPSSRWVIQVHGRAVRRAETLRAVPVFREARYNSLLITYRNDGDAPASADGRYGLGDTEWSDVDAAMRFAVDHGATDIVLMGWSMGGATVLQALTRSDLRGHVRGVVLDSPVVDWVTALRHQGQLLRLPNPIRSAAIALIGAKWAGRLTGQHAPVNMPRLDFVRRSADLHVPILLMHSDDDGYIPSTASRALAEARPDIVTFEAFTGAGHTRLWNYDPARWNAAIRGWLAATPFGQGSTDHLA